MLLYTANGLYCIIIIYNQNAILLIQLLCLLLSTIVGGLFLDHYYSPPLPIVPEFNKVVIFTVPRLHEVTSIADTGNKRFSIFGRLIQCIFCYIELLCQGWVLSSQLHYEIEVSLLLLLLLLILLVYC